MCCSLIHLFRRNLSADSDGTRSERSYNKKSWSYSHRCIATLIILIILSSVLHVVTVYKTKLNAKRQGRQQQEELMYSTKQQQ
ncbi:unnamed protein product, partial [Orchesella dallaii]